MIGFIHNSSVDFLFSLTSTLPKSSSKRIWMFFPAIADISYHKFATFRRKGYGTKKQTMAETALSNELEKYILSSSPNGYYEKSYGKIDKQKLWRKGGYFLVGWNEDKPTNPPIHMYVSIKNSQYLVDYHIGGEDRGDFIMGWKWGREDLEQT